VSHPTTQDELERALRETEAWLQAVVSNAPIVIFATDASGIFTVSAGKGRESLGLAAGEGVGLSAYEVFADFPQVGANLTRALAGESFTDTVVVGDLAFETWYGPSRDGVGNVAGVIGVATDVTRQHRAQLALERNAQRRSALLRCISDIIAVFDMDGTLRYCSPSAGHVLGYDEANAPTNVLDIVHPDDHASVLAAGQSAVAGEPVPVEFRLRHADGTWRWLSAIGTDLRHDPDVGGVLVTARDVTAGKDADEAARTEAARFGALVEHLSDMIVLLDERGRVRWASPSTRRLTSSDGPVFDLVHPDDLEAAQRLLTELIAEPGAVRRFECRIRGANDEWRTIETIATNLLQDAAVAAIVCNSRDITERRVAEQELVRRAYVDGLTGLPNRALFLDRLQVALARAGRRQSKVAVLFLDLDRFKVINESLGHEPGDRLLEAVARRLEAALRPEDTVARFGGDEFTVLCEDIRADSEPIGIAERINRALATPFTLGDREVFLTASIGIALAPRQAHADSLLRDADAAMHRAKERGRARFEIFDEGSRASAMERLETEHDLHRAVERGELSLRYQPIVELRGGGVVGVEALVRWEHPRRGEVAPAGFIPLAEETGLIVPIGEWVLGQACRQVAAWRGRGVLPEGFSVSINLSAGQLAQPGLAGVLDDALDDTAIDPRSVWLEITESALLVDAEAAIATLQALKDRGLCLSIDDFGTGYSSLSYLKRLPIDALKVDRSFVSGVVSDSEDHAIAEAVVALAHTLGLGAVAEGVETAEQLAEVRVIGCDSAQGYLFSRPVPAGTVEALLRSRPRW
jgi:diguanylate cyclase (GGDEF)-like protein/PAS domain S-box-containing protein